MEQTSPNYIKIYYFGINYYIRHEHAELIINDLVNDQTSCYNNLMSYSEIAFNTHTKQFVNTRYSNAELLNYFKRVNMEHNFNIGDIVYYLGEYYKIAELGSVFYCLENGKNVIRADAGLVVSASYKDAAEHLIHKTKKIEQEIEFFKE